MKIKKIIGLLEHIAAATVLLALLFVFHGSLNSYFRSKEASIAQDFEETAQREFQAFITACDRDLFLTKAFVPLLKILYEKPHLDLATIHNHFQTKYGMDINLFIYDSDANLIKNYPANPPNIYVINKLYAFLNQNNFNNFNSENNNRLNALLKQVLGYGKDYNSIRNDEGLIIYTAPMSSASEEQSFGFFSWLSRKEGGVIVRCNSLPEPSLLMTIYKKNIQQNSIILDCGQVSENENITPASTSEISEISKNLKKQGKNSGYYNKAFYIFGASNKGLNYFMSFKTSPSFFYYARIFTNVLAIVLVILFLWLIKYKDFLSKFTLKQSILTILVASALVPTITLLQVNDDSTEVFKATSLNELLSNQHETLQNVVFNFDIYLKDMSLKLTELAGRLQDQKQDWRTRAAINEIKKIYPDAKISVLDAAGDPMYFSDLPFSIGEKSVFQALGRVGIERDMPERADEAEYRANPLTDYLVRSGDLGFAQILDYPGTLQLYEVSDVFFGHYYNLFKQEKNRSSAVVFIKLPMQNLLKHYLESAGVDFTTDLGKTVSIYVFDLKRYRWFVPPPLAQESQMRKMAVTAAATNSDINYLDTAANKLLSAVIPGKLDQSCFVSISSFEDIASTYQKSKKRSFALFLTGSILFVLFGIFVYQKLILPMESLEKGIEAMGEHRYEFRLPHHSGKDELATLFTQFNTVMEENQDLMVAKNVQEGLITHDFPQTPRFSVFGETISSYQVGGNCLDSFMIDSEHIFFLIGNLSSYGIASALMIAFVRALTFHWSETENPKIKDLLTEIDKMLRKYQEQKIYMGAVAGILNSITGELSIVVQGHIPPMILKQNREIQWLKSPSLPLGSPLQKMVEPIKLQLEPGDKMFCFTVGLMNELTLKGYADAYEKIEHIVKEASIPENAKQAVEKFKSLFVLEKPKTAVHQINNPVTEDRDYTIFALNYILGEETT
ncbi:MAG: SpoIIE family protein phosphatase [Candidatus Riflebacteria bacterium]|nr:SpoIIE family protein phosphatase [Candidatus Riflebacteria bacterium]